VLDASITEGYRLEQANGLSIASLAAGLATSVSARELAHIYKWFVQRNLIVPVDLLKGHSYRCKPEGARVLLEIGTLVRPRIDDPVNAFAVKATFLRQVLVRAIRALIMESDDIPRQGLIAHILKDVLRCAEAYRQESAESYVMCYSALAWLYFQNIRFGYTITSGDPEEVYSLDAAYAQWLLTTLLELRTPSPEFELSLNIQLNTTQSLACPHGQTRQAGQDASDERDFDALLSRLSVG
jgi:hypothetical protein